MARSNKPSMPCPRHIVRRRRINLPPDCFLTGPYQVVQVLGVHSGAAGGRLGRVQTLAGHASDVSCFYWGADDRRCWTATEGYLFEWDVSKNTKQVVVGASHLADVGGGDLVGLVTALEIQSPPSAAAAAAVAMVMMVVVVVAVATEALVFVKIVGVVECFRAAHKVLMLAAK